MEDTAKTETLIEGLREVFGTRPSISCSFRGERGQVMTWHNAAAPSSCPESSLSGQMTSERLGEVLDDLAQKTAPGRLCDACSWDLVEVGVYDGAVLVGPDPVAQRDQLVARLERALETLEDVAGAARLWEEALDLLTLAPPAHTRLRAGLRHRLVALEAGLAALAAKMLSEDLTSTDLGRYVSDAALELQVQLRSELEAQILADTSVIVVDTEVIGNLVPEVGVLGIAAEALQLKGSTLSVLGRGHYEFLLEVGALAEDEFLELSERPSAEVLEALAVLHAAGGSTLEENFEVATAL